MRRFAKHLLFFAVSVLALASLTIAWSGKAENNETDALEAVAVPLLAAAPVEPQSTGEEPAAPPPAEELGTIASPESPAAVSAVLTPVASGTAVKENASAVIDYSNTLEGYVMVRYTGSTDKRLKARVQGPSTTYTYDLTAGEWEVFPLSDGNGGYQVTVFKNISGTKYTTELSASMKVELKDEFGPYLYPNQYVDYGAAPNAVAKAAELTAGKTGTLEKVAAIYDYVVRNLTYDREKAATVQSGYLPVLDTVLAAKKGICFDYASLMTGMLRSQGIPCKLVVGYAGGGYHAWINVWSEENGWINQVIFFDGTTWQRMDPTFASSGKQSASTMAYIGNSANYTAKYLY